MKYIFSLFIVMFFVSCSATRNDLVKFDNDNILDLKRFPQSSLEYLNKSKIDGLETSSDEYEKRYFRVWNEIPKDTKEEVMWPFSSFTYGDMYGENLKLIGEDVFKDIEYNSNFDKYKTLNKNAVTLRHTDIRAFPTSKPMFRKPSIAGEGFPFDYMQNSTVSANKPILISHYSKDKEWAFIFTSFTSGWVKSKDVIAIDKKYTNMWQKAKQVFITKDGIPLYDEKGNFLFESRVGMMLALVKEYNSSYRVLTVSSYKYHQPNYHKTKLSKYIASKEIMEFKKDNIQKIFDEVSKSKYGWGGMYGQRDCSSTLRDMFAPFGVWLPRNSYQQSVVGKVISLDGLSDEQKLQLIKKEAKPFRTLFYKQGHILLYVGVMKGEVVALHNVWGVKTKQGENEGRIVIGRTVYSSLKLGEEQKYYDADSEILSNLKSMNIIAG